MTELIVLLVPFAGTSLGAMMVFFMKDKISGRTEKMLPGFAAGVMMAAFIWSLLVPSIELSGGKAYPAWVPGAVGFLLGILFLLGVDRLVLFLGSRRQKDMESGSSGMAMLLLAVTVHNIPEGMAVGVAYAGAVSGSTAVTVAGAFALSIGIAIQNFPEGAIISMPLKGEGMGRGKAFLCGVLSGIVEPAAGLLTIFLTEQVAPFMPYFLSFAAGAMFYVVVEELVPESQAGEHSYTGTVWAAAGFALMMILDVALG